MMTYHRTCTTININFLKKKGKENKYFSFLRSKIYERVQVDRNSFQGRTNDSFHSLLPGTIFSRAIRRTYIALRNSNEKLFERNENVVVVSSCG